MADEVPRRVRLPLTEAAGEAKAPGITTEVIAVIVDEFYGACRADPVLGPVFNAQVQDWDEHLATIRAFWGAAMLGTGGYAGRPLEAHLAIPMLSREHFSVWLRLWSQTVRRHCTPEDASALMQRAGRMANRMLRAMGEAGLEEDGGT